MPPPHSVTISTTASVTGVNQSSPKPAGGATFPKPFQTGINRSSPSVQTGSQISSKTAVTGTIKQPGGKVELTTIITPQAPPILVTPPITVSTETIAQGSTETLTASPTSITVTQLFQPVTVTITGTGVDWSTGTTFSSSNPITLSIIKQVVLSETQALLTVVAGPPDGTVTISDGTSTASIVVSTLDEAFASTLLGYLPDLYENSAVMSYILNAQASQLNRLYQDIGLALNSTFVTTAPDWGLDLWELELGIVTDTTLSLETRRSTILQKIAGQGTPTIGAVIKSLAKYQDGIVEVYEDFADYTVYIQFVSKSGIPANLTALEAGVRAFIPAHLDIQYVFNLLTWNQLDGFNWSWDTLDSGSYTWTELTNL